MMSSSSRNILIIGYPKSGNTWLARLIAELLNCPVRGFWGKSNNHEIAIEGLQRSSHLQVFKGHHPFAMMSKPISQKMVEPGNIIYMIRDVRDVVLSGANFFDFPPNNLVARIIRSTPLIRHHPLINHLFLPKNNNSLTESQKIQEMIRTVSMGDNLIPWCSLPWDKHVQNYHEQLILMVRYEDLLYQPIQQCQRILTHLGMPKKTHEIETAIKVQSFNYIKQKFQADGDLRRCRFLRQGKSGMWRQKLNSSQKDYLLQRFHHTFKTFGFYNDQSN